MQDLRRPSIGERGRTSAELRGVSPSPNRWKIDGDAERRECPPYLFCRSSIRPSVRSFILSAGNGKGHSRARAGLIFKVPDEQNDRGLTFRARTRFHEKREGLLIVRNRSPGSRLEEPKKGP